MVAICDEDAVAFEKILAMPPITQIKYKNYNEIVRAHTSYNGPVTIHSLTLSTAPTIKIFRDLARFKG